MGTTRTEPHTACGVALRRASTIFARCRMTATEPLRPTGELRVWSPLLSRCTFGLSAARCGVTVVVCRLRLRRCRHCQKVRTFARCYIRYRSAQHQPNFAKTLVHKMHNTHSCVAVRQHTPTHAITRKLTELEHTNCAHPPHSIID